MIERNDKNFHVDMFRKGQYKTIQKKRMDAEATVQTAQ